MFESIQDYATRFGNLSEENIKQLTDRLEVLRLRKGESLLTEGRVCREFHFVSEGSFKHYCFLKDGTEAILNLYVKNDWMFDYKSLVEQKPSEAIIEANEDSVVFKLSGDAFHELVKLSDIFFRMGSIFQQAIQNQDYQNSRISPEEKYAALLANKPEIIQRFSLKLIASFLGITPETLSRVRRKLVSK